MALRPSLKLLDQGLVQQIVEEAYELLRHPGVRIHNKEALDLLEMAGARVDREGQIAFIPAELIEEARKTVPESFTLYNFEGQPTVFYGGDFVHFDPGSAAIHILDSQTQQQRPPGTGDFIRFVQLVEQLPQLDAQSTALIPADVPEEVGDLYRLYLALLYIRKPIITGAFRKDTLLTMVEMLEAAVGGAASLEEKPVAVFDVCPSPPLLWSDLTCQNLIDCARRGIPAEFVSMPLAGATAPVTLAGAVVQHTAECLSGLVISQLARSGAPVVWGGSPAVFDMREGTTPMGAVGTWMIDCAYVQVGKWLNLPTHSYLGMTDSKIVDAQAGLESAGGTLLAALAGVNMVSGAGMMDFESCQSLEKLVIDAEIIGMAKRLIRGIEPREDPLATDLIGKLGHRADYLSEPHTLRWFKEEFYIPSSVIDRGSWESWRTDGSKDSTQRAADRVEELLAGYQPPERPESLKVELRKIATTRARQFGMEELPPLPEA